MLVAQDRFCRFAVASWAKALFQGIIVDRKPGRVDPEFDEMAGANMLLENRVGNLEVFRVLSSHLDAIDQLVVVGELLGLEVVFEVHVDVLIPIPPAVPFQGSQPVALRSPQEKVVGSPASASSRAWGSDKR